MKIYSIYTSSKQEEEPIIIPQERSYTAGIFNALWALYHRMWFVAGVAILIDLLISFIVLLIGSASLEYVVEASIIIFFILFASEIREYSAQRQGYKLSDIIVASDEAEAEMKFYNRLEDWSSFQDIDNDDNYSDDSDSHSNKKMYDILNTSNKTTNPW